MGLWRWPAVVFVAGLVLTGSLAWFAWQGGYARDAGRFEIDVQRSGSAIEARLELYVGLLRAGAGLFVAHPSADREAFKSFVAHIDVPRHYPGVQGIGFAQRVRRDDAAGFLTAMRSAGQPSFDISPTGDRAEYFPIVFLEPMDRRNERAIGYDMFSEPTRYDAMSRARDQGTPVASGRVILVQEIDPEKQAGFLIYLPVYHGGKTPATEAERRELLQGFIYSPFRAGDFFAGVMGNEAMPGLRFEVFDGAEAAPERLLYTSAAKPMNQPQFSRTTRLQVADREWIVVYQSTPVFEAASARAWTLWVSLGGLIVSGMLGGITFALARTATQLRQRGLELFSEREQLRVTLASIGDAVISTNAAGTLVFMNNVAERLTGWTLPEARGRPLAKVFNIVDEKSGQPATDPVAQVRRTGRVTGLANETVLLSKDGSRLAIEDSAAPIKTPSDEIVGVVIVFHDVTEKRRAELALRERERLLRAAASGARVALMIVNRDYQYLFANETFCEVVGLSPERVLGRRVPDVLRDAWPQIQPRLDRALAGEQLSYELMVPAQAGSASRERWFTVIYEPQGGADERTVVVVYVDITERKRSEEALRASEARKDAILRIALDAIITIDHEDRLVEFNPAAEHIFGYKHDEVIGRLMAELLIPARLREQHYRGMKHYLRTGEGPVLRRQIELPAMRADGSEFPAELAILPIPETEPPMFTAFLRDITQRKHAEQLLRDAAERFRFMAESMPQKIFTARADGEFDYFNEQWMQFTGLTSAQLREGIWECCVHPDDAAVSTRRWTEAITRGEPFQLEHRIRRHDGVHRWHLTRAHAMPDAAGKVIMWIGSNTDIEDQKRHEAQLESTVAERTAALREINEQLEAFVYTIAHDLRGPLRSISGFSHVLMEDHSAALGEAARHLVARIQRSAEFMDRLILDLLAFGRTARAEIELTRVDVHKAWDIAASQTATQLEQAQAKIEAMGPFPIVWAHEATLGQVLANLLSNALKFVAPGVLPHIRFRAEDRGNAARLWVEDNGIGIDPSMQERIFRVFERLHGTRYAGTGIGLSIVKKGVERMGGRVGVESELGKGSRFWIELPKADS